MTLGWLFVRAFSLNISCNQMMHLITLIKLDETLSISTKASIIWLIFTLTLSRTSTFPKSMKTSGKDSCLRNIFRLLLLFLRSFVAKLNLKNILSCNHLLKSLHDKQRNLWRLRKHFCQFLREKTTTQRPCLWLYLISLSQRDLMKPRDILRSTGRWGMIPSMARNWKRDDCYLLMFWFQ